MYKTSTFRLHLIVFYGIYCYFGKTDSCECRSFGFYRMLLLRFFSIYSLGLSKKDSIKVSKKLLLKLVGIGSLMAFHWLFFFSSIKVSNVSIALSCLGTSTLFAALLEPFIFKRKIDVSEIVMGIVIVICISLIFKVEFQYKLGIIYGLICALLGTIFFSFNGKLYGKTSSGNIIFYEIFGGFLVISLYYVFSGQISQISEISYRDLALLTLLASVLQHILCLNQ